MYMHVDAYHVFPSEWRL